MNKELTQKLVKRFPVLYQNFYESSSNTCMCWGFEHGDGWFDIIWQLSLAINEELGYNGPRGLLKSRWYLLKKRWFKIWNNFIYKLSPAVQDKRKMVGSGVTGDPYRWIVVEKAKARLSWLKRLIVYPNTGLAVNQVKEKFGTLRFYCPGNDKIYAYVHMAEELSALMCEVCGKPAKLESPNGWMSTVCKEHSRNAR